MKLLVLAAGYATRLYPLDAATARRPCCRSAAGRCSTACSSRSAGVGRRRDVRRHERRFAPQFERVGGVGRRGVRIRARRRHDERTRTSSARSATSSSCSSEAGRRRRRRRGRRRQPVLGRSRRLRPLARRAGRSRCSRVYDVGDLAQMSKYNRSRPTTRADHVLRGEAGRADEHAERDRPLLLPAASAAADPPVPRRGKQPRPAGRLVEWLYPRDGLLHLALCPAGGTTSARPRRCARRTRLFSRT